MAKKILITGGAGYIGSHTALELLNERENEEYEPRQLDYDTGLPMKEAVRKKC